MGSTDRGTANESDRLPTLFDSLPDTVVLHDSAGTILDVNSQASVELGYTREELRSMRIPDIEVGIDREELVAMWEELDEGERTRVEGRHRRANGTTYPTEVTFRKVDIEGDERVLALSRDITERMEYLRELRQLKEEYETVFNTAQDGIFLFDVEETDGEYEFRLQNLNPAHEEISGMSADEDRGKTPEEFLGEEEGQEVVENYRRCVEAQGPISYEEELEMPGGTIYWQTRLAPVIEDGEVIQLVGIARDITESKEQERRLRRFEAFLDNSPTMMTLLEPDGTVLLDKSGIGVDWRHPPEEFIDTNVMEYIHPDDQDRVASAIETLTQQPGEPISVEYRFKDRHGEWRWLRTTAVNEIEEPLIEGIIAVSIDVTERRRQEAHLEEAQSVGEMGSWHLDIVEDELVWSDEVYEIFGVDHDTPMTYDRFLEYVHPDDREYVDGEWNAAVVGEPYDIEHRIVTEDGETRWVRERADVEFDVEGEPVSGIGIVQDITERKEREQKLERLRRYLENLRDAVAVFNKDAQLEYLSPTWEELTGYQVDEAFEVNPFKYVHPDERDSVIEQHQDILEQSELEETIEFRFKRADDTYCWLEVKGKNFVDDPDIGGVLLTIRDISDRKQVEEELKRQQQFTEDLLNAIEDVVYVIDPDGRLREWNDAMEIVTGYDSEAIEAMDATDFFADEDRETVVTAVSEAYETGRTRVELDFLTADGERVPYEFVANSFEDPDGEPVMAGIGRDRSQHVEYEQTLEEQRDNLELLNQVVRHDIRNDMTVIRGRVGLLRDSLEEGGGEDLEAVIEATENVIELTKSARDLSETMLSTVEDIGPVRLDRHLERPIEDARSQFRDAVITVDRIPDVRVRGNEILDAVFRNLIHNAVVHNDKSVPEVHISTTIDDGTVTVNVADNGPGIPDDRKDDIFGKGETGLDSAGTGIGLYLVQTLVDQYGGHVWVEDNDPEGSVFYVELPLADGEVDQ